MTNTELQILLQLPNLLGVISLYIVGRKKRYGWLIAIASEIAWAVWAYLSHNPGVYPWCAVWAVVQVRNWWLWRHDDKA